MFRSAIRAWRPDVGSALVVSALLPLLVLAAAPGVHAASGYYVGATFVADRWRRHAAPEAGVMNFLASVLIALLAWALLSWVCGIALGCMIDLMEGEDEFDDRGTLPT